ncbi:MAG: TetR/AcrR family transcriptional regulator [Phycisphaerales bacterium]
MDSIAHAVNGDERNEPANRRSRRQAEIRERLVRCALRLFAERGFVATTVEDITNLADVGKGTFFNYFPSKEHIFAARAQGQAQKVERFVAQVGSSTEPMADVFYRLAVSLSEGFEGSPAVFHAIMVAVCTNELVRDMLSGAMEQARKSLAELMSLGQRRGEVRGDLVPIELAMVFQRAFFGTMFLWSVTPSRPLTDCLKETSNFVWSAIRKGPA